MPDWKQSGDESLATGLSLACIVLSLIAIYFSTIVLLDGDYVAALIAPAVGLVVLVGLGAIAHKMGLPIVERIKNLYSGEHTGSGNC